MAYNAETPSLGRPELNVFITNCFLCRKYTALLAQAAYVLFDSA